ncbi:hypothetical protein B0H11DRAFT_1917029 [Mycena galericulata]|nr:hypothetical protein B0H11DRAFT_1917029 [Mycena galericulata]
MPPKKEPKTPEGFALSSQGNDTVTCLICAAAAPPGRSIQRAGAAQHTKSRDHQRAVQHQNEQDLQRQRAESARTARQELPEELTHLPRTHLHLPEPAPVIDNQMQEFWAEFDADASNFEVNFDPSAAELAARDAEKIRKELDAFGDFDDIELGYELGTERDADLLAENRARHDEQQMEDALAALLSSGDYTENPFHENDSNWYPYPSKLLFLLDVADNLGRLRISESLMKLFLIGALRKFQGSLRDNGSGVPTLRCQSVQDKIFYVNDIRKMIANDWCNPHTRPHIRIYPEIPENGVVSEIWHGEKWTKHLDSSLLSPMWAASNGRHYYLNELAQLHSGKYVIPLRWLTRHRQVEADAYEVSVDEDYANSLIGRQLKAVIQTAVFHVHDLLGRAVAVLAALLWVPEIDDMDQYCVDLKIAVANVLDAFAEIDPSKMILKIKLHLLTHLPDDARSFGPLIGIATEIFESFNAVFRAASVLSNHRAPSRDIARQLANQEGARAVALGSSWLDVESQEWRSAGPSIKRFMNAQPSLKRMMGLNIHNDPKPGTTRLAPLPKRVEGMPRPQRQTVNLEATHAPTVLQLR